MTILSQEEIKYFKNNKDKITFELLQALRSHGNVGKRIALDILDCEQDDAKYYLDAFGKRISYNGDRALKKAFTKMKLYPIHIEEIQRCVNDIFYFMENYVRIMTKTGTTFPELREYQHEMLEIISNYENEKMIIKLGRQGGKSVITGIWLLHIFNFSKDVNMGILANKGSMAKEYLDKVKKMFVLLPVWIQTGIVVWNKTSIEGESNIRILTDVPSDSSFRGYSMHYLIFDEAAWMDSNKFFEARDALLPAQSSLSKKKIILISTPNGRNHFYDIWEEGGKTLSESKNGYITFETDWKNIPRYDSKGNLYKPEDFKRDVVKANGNVFFSQNYECDFIGSGNTLIPGEILAKYEIKSPEYIHSKYLNIYEDPIENHKYIIGVDSAKDGRDNFSVQVLDITNFPFKQVASASCQVDYLSMPEFLEEWGNFYNFAFIVIENNEGSGQSIADTLYKSIGYSNLYFDFKTVDNQRRKKYPGFRTTRSNRNILLQTLKSFAQDGVLELCDKNTINELFDFKLINGKFQADSGKHDDSVMALCMCLSIFSDVKNFEDMIEVIKAIKSDDSKSQLFDFINIANFDDGSSFDNMYDDYEFFSQL